MTPTLNRIFKLARVPILRVAPSIIYLIKKPYWAILGIVIKHWGKRDLHSITVGEFVGGETKTRSRYREDMILKALIMSIYMREKSCLDLACNDGFWSFRLARFGIKALEGIDWSWKSIVRANFLKSVHDFPSFKFHQKDIFQFLYNEKAKSYDIILMFGVIYHLPETTDWEYFFKRISQINNECLVIDSRWFENDEYWYDKTSGQALIKTKEKVIKKWRPTRKEVIEYLDGNGYEQIIEINPSGFLMHPEEAYGNRDPYTLENVSDYLTDNRSLVIGYKKNAMMPCVQDKLVVKYL